MLSFSYLIALLIYMKKSEQASLLMLYKAQLLTFSHLNVMKHEL